MAFIHVEHQLINVDHIVKAVYDDKVQTLKITLSGSISMPNPIELTGDVATAAWFELSKLTAAHCDADCTA